MSLTRWNIRLSLMWERLFWFWYAVGLLLMLFYKVPAPLRFSNGLFLVFFACYAVSLAVRLSKRPMAVLGFVGIGLLSMTVEGIGVRFGWPFGDYAYTDVLGWALFGVPLAIGFAWTGVMAMAWLQSPFRNRFAWSLETAGWVVLFDLVLDPVAFQREMWVWEPVEGFAPGGVPLSNYGSWFLLALVFTFLLPAGQVEPVGSEADRVRRKAKRLYQGMLLLFALLAWKAGLYLPACIGLAGIILAEWRWAYAGGYKKSGLQSDFPQL